ncbi:hypothetical protein Trco_007777 [Trichoderma cornu-damae]|uniref:Uncharacterized protein n=1 Tax=Trichoderma cornu-damae TaxID=654480 RepID=A0A9P8QEP2_9HYPO|nr:hypothetical protein Trco_007777 [Trichoderma cornu-damae]
MWCIRVVALAAILFSGRVMGRVTVTISDIPDAIYLTTTLTIYDGTVAATAQIAGIALGGCVIFGLFATIFFCFGRRNACPAHSDRRISIYNVGAGLGSFKTKMGRFWKKSPKQQADKSHGATTPAELMATAVPQRDPSPPERHEILPVELPTSVDPGNSPLPKYEDLDTPGRYRVFSWAAPETAYRPDKFEPGNKI